MKSEYHDISIMLGFVAGVIAAAIVVTVCIAWWVRPTDAYVKQYVEDYDRVHNVAVQPRYVNGVRVN